MDLDKILTWPVLDVDPGFNRLACVLVQQRNVKSVSAERSAMRNTRECMCRIEVQTGLWGVDRVIALQMTLDKQLSSLLAEEFERPVDRHAVTVSFVRAFSLVGQALFAGCLDREQRLGIV